MRSKKAEKLNLHAKVASVSLVSCAGRRGRLFRRVFALFLKIFGAKKVPAAEFFSSPRPAPGRGCDCAAVACFFCSQGGRPHDDNESGRDNSAKPEAAG